MEWVILCPPGLILSFDPNPLRGVSYYRLRQTGHDGTFTYSQVLTIKGWQPVICQLSFIPIRAIGQIRIVSSGMIDEIKISNITGKLLIISFQKKKIFLFNLSNQEFICSDYCRGPEYHQKLTVIK